MKGGTCLGYLTSIANIQTSGAAVGGRKACIPPNADMNQIVDVFRGYRRDHPERRHLPAQISRRKLSFHRPTMQLNPGHSRHMDVHDQAGGIANIRAGQKGQRGWEGLEP